MEQDNKKSMAFSSLSNSQDLCAYLDSNSRLKDTEYLYQYTTISSLINMLRSKTLHLSNAKYMNDQLEYQNGDAAVWHRLLYSCFMMEEDESIGMWGMYAQPWKDGVKIAFPKAAFREWVDKIDEIIEISQTTKQPTGKKIDLDNNFHLWISAVAYSNCDSLNLKKGAEILKFGGQENDLIHNASHRPELTGYIKDMAWSYEKEVRLKLQFWGNQVFERAAIRMPEDIIDSLIITPSPLFEGEIYSRIKQEINRQMNIGTSKFINKLNIRTPCDNCSRPNK